MKLRKFKGVRLIKIVLLNSHHPARAKRQDHESGEFWDDRDVEINYDLMTAVVVTEGHEPRTTPVPYLG